MCFVSLGVSCVPNMLSLLVHHLYAPVSRFSMAQASYCCYHILTW